MQHPPPLFDVMRKDIDNLEFVEGVRFEFIISLKSNGTKYLLNFDDPCAEICNSKESVDLATAGRHRGFSIYTLNTKYSIKLNWEGMLSCKTHILVFSSHLEMCIKLLH